MADSRTAAFLNGDAEATPRAAAAIVLLALGGVILLRKLRFSVNASL